MELELVHYQSPLELILQSLGKTTFAFPVSLTLKFPVAARAGLENLRARATSDVRNFIGALEQEFFSAIQRRAGELLRAVTFSETHGSDQLRFHILFENPSNANLSQIQLGIYHAQRIIAYPFASACDFEWATDWSSFAAKLLIKPEYDLAFEFGLSQRYAEART